MKKQTFLVSLNAETVPPKFFEMFSEYLGQWRDVHHFLAQSIDFVSSFVVVSAIPNNETGAIGKIHIHGHYVLAIADFDEGNPPIGFLQGSK